MALRRTLAARLRGLCSKLVRPPRSSIEAAARLMRRREFEVLYRATPDRRCVPAAVARALGRSEESLLERLARTCAIGFSGAVPACDPAQLPVEMNIACLRKAGAIPLIQEGSIAALACVDPAMVDTLLIGPGLIAASVPLILSPWSVISAALDASEQRQREAQTRAAAAAGSAAHPSVLVVEDDPIFARVVSRFLASQGVDCVCAGGGAAALEGVQSAVPALIICDEHMPGMSGIEFIRRVRADERCATVPIILLTSDENVDTELRALNEGADAFVRKSEDPRVLEQHVRRLIERRRKEAA